MYFADVKPSNMLVNTDGKVKICDFGVSIQVCDFFAILFWLENLSSLNDTFLLHVNVILALFYSILS